MASIISISIKIKKFMSKKIFSLVVFLTIFSLTVFFSPALAKHSELGDDIPEQDGVYNVPSHPELKVRVFVHKAKPDKPGKPSPEPTLICDLPDPESEAIVGPAGWHLPTGVWQYQLNIASVPSLVGSANLPTMAETAFSQWASNTNGKVAFTRGADTTLSVKGLDGKNIIAWGRTSASALGVTYTWYNSSTLEVVETDTIMNKKFIWSWSVLTGGCARADAYDAQNILTHELGHWLGLNDHYTADYANATMYGYGSKAEIKKDTLSSGDAAGTRAIYY
jgi:hypothetical protein